MRSVVVQLTEQELQLFLNTIRARSLYRPEFRAAPDLAAQHFPVDLEVCQPGRRLAVDNARNQIDQFLLRANVDVTIIEGRDRLLAG